MIKDFYSFLTKSNALALAIGVIIGAAVGKVVSALTDDILMPIIGLVLNRAPMGDRNTYGYDYGGYDYSKAAASGAPPAQLPGAGGDRGAPTAAR